ncbi:MAG: hypothetical protein IJ845_10775 [Bacteroidaceae bacterium]|nr:hypothetical protein [Bacteroidaceae bacterium]
MKKTIWTLLAVLIISMGARAQSSGIGGINLSLWPGIATQGVDTVSGKPLLNLGVNSKMNQLTGIGVNVLGSTTVSGVNGLQLSGLFNVVGEDMRGWQAAGITNVVGGDLTGVSVSGLVNVIGGQTSGLLMTGGVNVLGDGAEGIIASGLLNIVGGEAKGIQLAGIGNIDGDPVYGMQLAGLFNVSAGETVGLQASGLLNVAAEQMTGVQVGLLNVAASAMNGFQIGLFNFHADRLRGLQIGLINANPSTRVQLLVGSGTSTLFNVGLRFKSRTFYTVLSAGTKYRELHPFNTAFTYRAGLAIPVAKALEISGDLGFLHIETFRKHEAVNRLYNLQARLNLEYQCTEKVALFLTGGYERGYTYRHGHLLHDGLFGEIGTALTIGSFKVTK